MVYLQAMDCHRRTEPNISRTYRQSHKPLIPLFSDFKLASRFNAVFSICSLENAAPMLQCVGKRFVYFPIPTLVWVIPKSILTMPIVQPTRVVHNRIQANPMHGNARSDSGLGLLAHITK